jgi:phosphate transport system substrate-binding protein
MNNFISRISFYINAFIFCATSLLRIDAQTVSHSTATYNTTNYDLSQLPEYKPTQRVTGVLRIYGTPLEDLVGAWMSGFRNKNPQVRLNCYLINTSQAFAGLISGKADVGLMGHKQWRNGLKAFEDHFGYDPLEIRFANGSFDDPQGTTPGLVFIVNKKNPITGLTLDQIDGIFGTERTGGWIGTKWTTKSARSADKNIRRWGEIGINGELSDKEIHPYGSDVTLSNWADLIERVAFHGGTKWNPEFVEAPRADISTKAKGKTRDQLILEAVEKDPQAIGFIFQRVINANHGDVKILPIANDSKSPFILPSSNSFFSGSYPFHNGAYLYFNRKPGTSLSVREAEFVRFILSREGQHIVAASRLFIPLNAQDAANELKKIDQ